MGYRRAPVAGSDALEKRIERRETRTGLASFVLMALGLALWFVTLLGYRPDIQRLHGYVLGALLLAASGALHLLTLWSRRRALGIARSGTRVPAVVESLSPVAIRADDDAEPLYTLHYRYEASGGAHRGSVMLSKSQAWQWRAGDLIVVPPTLRTSDWALRAIIAAIGAFLFWKVGSQLLDAARDVAAARRILSSGTAVEAVITAVRDIARPNPAQTLVVFVDWFVDVEYRDAAGHHQAARAGATQHEALALRQGDRVLIKIDPQAAGTAVLLDTART